MVLPLPVRTGSPEPARSSDHTAVNPVNRQIHGRQRLPCTGTFTDTGKDVGRRRGRERNVNTPETRAVPTEQPEITAAGIARLAGVGRAAVSNWRRRHADFPQPVGGTATSPAFALREVEEWLRHHGKTARVPLEERAWQLLVAEPGEPSATLVAVGELLLGGAPAGDNPSPASDDLDALRPGRPLREAVAALAAERGTADAFRDLLRRHLTALTVVTTPAETAALMAEIAGPARTVLDPACGAGTLLAAARGPRGGAPRELRGQEKDPDLARLAGLRLAMHGAHAVRVDPGDSLLADRHADARVDAVLCHPPANERHWGHDDLAYDTRWEYGLPARGESELAWLQHALARLRPGGTAVVLLPPAVASR
ncbi:N-6 DNA methylase, partial [Streptomyces bohaiensis]|nr:N-6 DNA methylase [Streptomyces bohaiensis]